MLSVQTHLLREVSYQTSLNLPKPKRGNPNFKNKWQSKTTAIRVPEKYADKVLSICKQWESDNEIALNSLPNATLPNSVAYLSIDSLKTDPKRFQYKLIQYDSYGSTNSLLGVSQWDETLAGILLVWLDPSDNVTYVINGHNRYSKAKSLGVSSLLCRYIKADNATQARAIGALLNIAEGNGTPIDAAKFFRDSQLSEGQVKGRLPLSKKTVTQGLSLAKLGDPLFSRLVDDRLSVDDGVIIGDTIPGDRQGELLEILDQGVSGPELSEYCQLLMASETQETYQDSLFGLETVATTGLVEKSRVIVYTKQRLAKEKRIFSTVAKNSNDLAKGNNTIDRETSQAIGDRAKNALILFDQLKLQAGRLSDLIAQAANNLINRDDYYTQVVSLLNNPLAV